MSNGPPSTASTAKPPNNGEFNPTMPWDYIMGVSTFGDPTGPLAEWYEDNLIILCLRSPTEAARYREAVDGVPQTKLAARPALLQLRAVEYFPAARNCDRQIL